MPSRTPVTPTLAHERWLWARGHRRIAGVDEAGRGALAGPVVAAAVVLPDEPSVHHQLDGVRDSKLLTPAARDALYETIRAVALGVGVAAIDAALVDGAGIAAAGRLALCRAVAALPVAPTFVIVDAFRLPALRLPQLALVRADTRCLSVAAASVIAKVCRDRLMTALHAEYPPYGFHQHKGYGTAAHNRALARHGPCAIHRRSFAPVRVLCES